jgi:flagellar protein FlgJ
MLDSDQTRMYTSMLDQQLTQRMASRGIGLADVMVRQLSTALNVPNAVGATPDAGVPAGFPLNEPGKLTALPTPAEPARSVNSGSSVEAFVQRLRPHAEAASATTGIPARFMLGQAALETGWGKAEIRGADGQNSHNLFGIKAGSGWKGRTVDIVTTEYVNGKPQKQVDTFRAYDSYADAFRDYANLLRANPRYQNVIAQGQDAAGFAQGLQQAGYATDPAYAQKLMGVIQRIASA